MSEATNRRPYDGSEIAIIGMVCRAPGSPSVEHFWLNLQGGAEGIRELDGLELEPSRIDPAIMTDPNYVRASGVLDEIDLFDAQFFGYTPLEAEIMDPQQRIFLECAWETLETAGYDPFRYKRAIGVFCGARPNTYLYNVFSNQELVARLGAFNIGLGNDLAFLSARVSHRLDLKGPCYSIHTACSTSLVAVHLACQSLLVDECQMAIAGGVSISVPQNTGYLYQQGGILSDDGHCRPFDAAARGTVLGSGVGVVLLKRLEDALADGDQIYSIILGTAVNNDGANKPNFTAPSATGQARVIAEALANAGVSPESIGYVEAHGTGTPIGDPIEIRALTKAFGVNSGRRQYCAIGSLKSNVGHLDAAAGIASLIKAALCLEQNTLVPSLYFETPNQQINFSETPFYVNTSLRSWEPGPEPRRAGVSSFAIGGTNAHVILEEAPQTPMSEPARLWQLLLLSAATDTALEAASSNLADYLSSHQDVNLEDAAFTLQVGRAALSYRKAVVCETLSNAVTLLRAPDSRKVVTGYLDVAGRSVAFMFPGQGSQYAGMGSELYDREPVFRTHIDLCSNRLVPILGRDLRELLFARDPSSEVELGQTQFTQTALFALEYALAKVWMSLGVQPDKMIGHSVGEYVAACLAGVFSLEDALLLIAERGKLMQALPPGAMTAVPQSEFNVHPHLTASLSVAATNGPELTVVSGPLEEIALFEKGLAERGVSCHRLATSHAFHSQMMEPVIDAFKAIVSRVRLFEPQIRFISNLTGTWITDEEATSADYWAKHLRYKVRFGDGLDALLQDSAALLLEVGPRNSLSKLAKRARRPNDQAIIATMESHDRKQSESESFLIAVGKAWLAGAEIDWTGLHNGQRRRRISLPTYPFERKIYWVAAREFGTDSRDKTPVPTKLPLDKWFHISGWKRTTFPAILNGAKHAAGTSLWFVRDNGFERQAADRFNQEGRVVIEVTPGEKLQKLGSSLYSVNPNLPGDYFQLFAELAAHDSIPEEIVHCWSIDCPIEAQTKSQSDFLDQVTSLGFLSLIHLCQAIGESAPDHKMRLVSITSGLHGVTGSDRFQAEKAPLLAACMVIPQEYPNISSRLIDLDGSEITAQDARLADVLLEELAVPNLPVVSYRAGHRWLPTFESVELGQGNPGARRIRDRGVYLITGGLGAVGMLLAEHLARTYKARLALVGRSKFPERPEWDQWVAAHGPDDTVSRKIEVLKSFAEVGAEVVAFSANIANESEMQEVVDRITETFGRIDGVIHAAGVTGGQSAANLISNVTEADVRLQFEPKVRGLYVLERVLRDRPLDFCLLMSSNAAVLGGLGTAAYSAANLFMDSFAVSRRRAGEKFWISSNWDHWPEETRRYKAVQTSTDVFTMTTPESIEAFERVVGQVNEPRIVVSTGDLSQRVDLWINRSSSKPAEHVSGSSPALHSRPRIDSPFVGPRSETEQAVVEIWQELLGLDLIGVNDSFFELGGHSLHATQLVGKLKARFNTQVPLGRFFESPTVAGLAAIIDGLQHDEADSETQQILELLHEMSEEEAEAELSRMSQQEVAQGHAS